MCLTSNNGSVNGSVQKTNFDEDTKSLLPSSSYKMMSDEDFAKIGMNHVAYINTMEAGNGSCIIYAADGHTIAMTDTQEAAHAMVFANGLVPVMLH